jgi:hypothetical protein
LNIKTVFFIKFTFLCFWQEIWWEFTPVEYLEFLIGSLVLSFLTNAEVVGSRSSVSTFNLDDSTSLVDNVAISVVPVSVPMITLSLDIDVGRSSLVGNCPCLSNTSTISGGNLVGFAVKGELHFLVVHVELLWSNSEVSILGLNKSLRFQSSSQIENFTASHAPIISEFIGFWKILDSVNIDDSPSLVETVVSSPDNDVLAFSILSA